MVSRHDRSCFLLAFLRFINQGLRHLSTGTQDPGTQATTYKALCDLTLPFSLMATSNFLTLTIGAIYKYLLI